jgi:plastocyanin
MDAIVSVRDNWFTPYTVTIAAGGTVTWSLDGQNAHDISGSFASVVKKPGETFSFTFSAPGTYEYRCDIHDGLGTRPMTGRVVVQ